MNLKFQYTSSLVPLWSVNNACTFSAVDAATQTKVGPHPECKQLPDHDTSM